METTQFSILCQEKHARKSNFYRGTETAVKIQGCPHFSLTAGCSKAIQEKGQHIGPVKLITLCGNAVLIDLGI
jgi:hypothetical protein